MPRNAEVLKERILSGKSVTWGFSSGIGNAIFCLPAIKALRSMGATVHAYLDTDYDMVALFSQSPYFETVSTTSIHEADFCICGLWCPRAMKGIEGLRHYKPANPDAPWDKPEWEWALQAAIDLGYEWDHHCIDVSDWIPKEVPADMVTVLPDLSFDFGIIPGSKDGTWTRKRFPCMGEVVKALHSRGLSTIAIGLQSDNVRELDGLKCEGLDLDLLPQALRRCKVVIGTDSGPTHLASSLGIPAVVIYTATSEKKGEPVGGYSTMIHGGIACRPCSGTSLWGACQDWKCRDLAPNDIVEAAVLQKFIHDALKLN